MSSPVEIFVDVELVRAAVRAAENAGRDVADLPLTELAAAAGVSRSTLVRRLGGSRQALDEAVRAAGVDPGGRRPVRRRATEAAAELIGEDGLAAVTLERVAAAADCSVHSVYAAFGGRDRLLAAVYESYTPLSDIERVLERRGELTETVRAVYRAFAAGLERQPRVAPAMLADAFANPGGPAGRLVTQYFPRALATLGSWLEAEITAGRVRPLPTLLLIQQMLGPLLMHVLSAPLLDTHRGPDTADLDRACAELADAFVRGVGTTTTTEPTTGRKP